MSERETSDFMSVDSFSQLPFIRQATSQDKSSTSPSAIRLFGIEVDPDLQQESPKDQAPTSDISNATTGVGRKFECHYCCRNFPTSQALGGHQNAHKRERQHAKRAHLQSAMAAHHRQSLSSGRHVYGILDYHHIGSIPPNRRFTFDPSPPSHYPSWSGPAGFYEGVGSVAQPINGNPLSALWQVSPSASHGGASNGMAHHWDRGAMPLPLFGREEADSGGNLDSSSFQFMGESMSSVKEDVSLDLRL